MSLRTFKIILAEPVHLTDRTWYNWLVLGVALSLTCTATFVLHRAIIQADRERFAVTVGAAEDRITRRMSAYPPRSLAAGDRGANGTPVDSPMFQVGNPLAIDPIKNLDEDELLTIRICDTRDGKILYDNTTTEPSTFTATRAVQIPGDDWNIDYHSTREFERRTIWWLVPLFAGTASLLALGLFLLSRAKVMAVARNAALYRTAMAARRVAELSLDINRRLASTLDPQAVAQAVTDAGREVTGAAFGAFFTLGPPTPKLSISALSGVTTVPFSLHSLPRIAELFCETITDLESLRLDDVRGDPRFHPERYQAPGGQDRMMIASFLAVPVRSRTGLVIGGLVFTHPKPGKFVDDHEGLLLGLAAQAAIALDHAQLFEAEREANRLAGHRANDLGQANAALQQFIYASSHDLQEPLRTITQYLDLLQRRHLGQLDEQARRYVTYASESASRMYDLLNDLLTYSRLGHEAERTLVDLTELTTEVMSDLRAVIVETQAQINVGTLPAVLCDRAKIRSLLQNLLGNAIKFRGTATPVIEITSRVDRDGIWTLAVADHGIGIPVEHRIAVFEVFHRLHERGDFPGTGIGLAICRKVVEQHHGRIWIESTEGGGATFQFTLPEDGSGSRLGLPVLP